MKLHIALIILILSIPAEGVNAQTSWFARDTLSAVSKDGRLLNNPWAGGLNAVQYGKMDLNGDDEEDLVVFDRTTSKISTFLADKARRIFVHRPEYELRFPAVFNWMTLADYDGDGKKELFTHTAQGVTVYRQQFGGEKKWSWERVVEYLTTRGLSGNQVNLQVAASDIPAIVDFDNDGDLDIICFEGGGDFVELNQNMSMERYGDADRLEFVRNGLCWGDFRKHTCDDFVFGVSCGVESGKPDNGRVKHAGNAILLHDLDGDGRKDMLLGNVDCENLSILFNEATGIAARFTGYKSLYPVSEPAVMPVFPAAYLEDVDFDGKKDLLVSPNVYGNDNLMMDFVASGWYYRNAGTDERPDFQLVRKDFLQADMVDVGENAAASFFDLDGDGLVDMLIGNRGRYEEEDFRGRLYLYKNKGTKEQPVFELQTDDYLALSAQPGHTDLQPQWIDVNKDGKPDLTLVSIKERKLHLRYFLNLGAAGGTVQLGAGTEVALPHELSVSDRVHFYDYDRDGDPDLVIGGVLGNVSLYENTGSGASARFVLRESALGGIGPGFSRRYQSVAVSDLNLDGRPDLVTVDQSGKINVYYEGNWGSWAKKDTAVVGEPVSGLPSAPSLGNRLHLSVGDLNGDGKTDIAVGTLAGGISLFRNLHPGSVLGVEPESDLRVYPNPAQSSLSMSSVSGGEVAIFDFLGNRRFAGYLPAGSVVKVPLAGWQAGVYLVVLSGNGKKETRKVIVHQR